MANLQIKKMDDDLYKELKALAASENRSVSQQVLHYIRFFISREKMLSHVKSPAETLLSLSGSWLDSRDAESIVAEIRSARKNSSDFKNGF
jgi:plasmid stability protein